MYKAALQLDLRELPFNAEFDIEIFDILEHIDDDEQRLAAIFRATRPAGGALLTVPQHPQLWSAADELGSYSRRYRKRDLVVKLNRAGFHVERDLVVRVAPAAAHGRVRRRTEARRGLRPGGRASTGRPLDVSMEGVMDVERAFIWRLAAGRRIAVGRRAA